MDRIDKSPRLQAGMTGFCYLITILTGRFAQGLVSGTLIVDGNASMTANNILAHKGLFELSFAIYLIEMASQRAMIALFYGLLRPVSKSVSLLAAFLGLAGCVIKHLAGFFTSRPRSFWLATIT